MPLELWGGESQKTIHACIHCSQRGEPGAKPFPKGLCPACSTMEKRREMHEENEKVMPGWSCGLCQKIAAKLAVT